MAPQRTIHEADAALDNDYGRLNLGRSLGASSAKVDLDCSGTCLFRTSARILLPTKLAQALIQTQSLAAVPRIAIEGKSGPAAPLVGP